MPLVVKQRVSSLIPDHDEILKVKIIQASSGARLFGYRNAFQGPQRDRHIPQTEIDEALGRLGLTEENALNVVSFHPGMRRCDEKLKELSTSRSVVTLGGVIQGRNITFIASGGTVEQQAKITLSSEDAGDGVVSRGSELNVFCAEDGSNAVRWAVLNCHDYTTVAVLRALLEQRVELIVVVTHNNATDLYWEYAVADVHRLFCYVVIVNVAELGGSGVFVPYRRLGFEKNATLRAGGRLFTARGPADISANFTLNIRDLRQLREEFATQGLDALDKGALARGYAAVVPSEHYMATRDRGAGAPPVGSIENVRVRRPFDRIRVGVSQLDSLSLPVYLRSQYRIRNDPACGPFERLLDVQLNALEQRCLSMGKTDAGAALDLLVLPEVFVPRPFAERRLRQLSQSLGAIVVCGLDYPGEGEGNNANECAVILPGADTVYYRKITRSQYDAKTDHRNGRMRMNRGDKLYRFVNDQGYGFGVLICYDFSHLDLIAELNLRERADPLDVLVVIAHNPFGQLYRTCCIADSHRFYQHVVMCNVAAYGGSGVYAPKRTEGARQTILDLGKGAESIALAELDLAALRAARQKSDFELNDPGGGWMRKPGLFQS